MVTAMTASKLLKNSTYLLSALLLAACQPSPPINEPVTDENSETVDSPIVITDDSVTMTPDHILNIKPSRYQPSLGLQGKIEPIKQTKLVAAYPINVEEILVTEGQWVEKDTPLLIVRRVQSESTATTGRTKAQSSETNNAVPDSERTNEAINSKQTRPQDTDIVSKPSQPTAENSTATAKDVPFVDEENSKPQHYPYNLVTVRASFSGRVKNLYAKTGQKVEARTP